MLFPVITIASKSTFSSMKPAKYRDFNLQLVEISTGNLLDFQPATCRSGLQPPFFIGYKPKNLISDVHDVRLIGENFFIQLYAVLLQTPNLSHRVWTGVPARYNETSSAFSCSVFISV